MIIFGSRMYGKKNTVNGWGLCDNCGEYGRHTNYNARKWGHLYFIPLIPEGPRVRVLKECSKCSHGMHIPEKDLPTIQNDLHVTTKNALAALIAGQKEFDDNGTIVSATASMAGSVEMLLCLQANNHLHSILTTLKEKGLMYQYYLVEGESMEFKGNLAKAAAAYRQAVNIDQYDPIALMSLGSIHMKKKDYQHARDSYERALSLSQDRFSVLEVLLLIYDVLKDHTKMVQTYEECFRLYPELTKDKQVFKAYKKACKKAGLQPRDN